MIDLGSQTPVMEPSPLIRVEESGPILVLTTAELAECTCPEFCERDHDVD
jgi:hypothetical protein